jgi:hypothetical protein
MGSSAVEFQDPVSKSEEDLAIDPKNATYSASIAAYDDAPKDDLAEPEDTSNPPGFWESLTSRTRPADLDAIATTRSVFDDPKLAKFYQPHPDYENLHRFDPAERWTYREEIAVRRRTDLKIFLWILVMVCLLNSVKQHAPISNRIAVFWPQPRQGKSQQCRGR